MDALYNQLIKAAIHQNKMIETQLRIPQQNFDKLYRKEELPFDDRLLTIRWIKIPTFIRENKPSFYAICLANISYWWKNEAKNIYQQCVESTDWANVDSQTLFLQGKSIGWFDQTFLFNYKIFRLNVSSFSKKERDIVISYIVKAIEKRISSIKEQNPEFITYGSIKKDVERLQYFIDTFTPLIITRTSKRNSKRNSCTNSFTNVSKHNAREWGDE